MIPIATAGLGKAFIEIHADTKPFVTELATKLQAIVDAAEKALKPVTVKVGQEIADGIGEGIKKNSGKISDEIKGAVKPDKDPEIDLAVDTVKNRSRFTTFFKNFTSGASSLGKGIVATLGTIFSGLKTTVANIFNIPEKSPLSTVLTVLALVVLPALIPLVIALAAAFADLLGFVALVPPGLAAILAILPPLIIGFKGLADAVELAFEKDPKKFREGLKEATPVVRELSLLLRGFVPTFERIGQKIEQAFLAPITRALGPTLRLLLPTLEAGLTTVSAAMGKFFARITSFLGSPTFENFLSELFPAVARMIERLTPAVVKILGALTRAAERALPFLEKFIDKFADFIERFADFIDRSIRNGDFDKFLEDAFTTLQDIFELIGSVTGLFHTLFSDLDDDGRNILDIITEMVTTMDNFFKSPEGKKFLKDLGDLAILFVEELKNSLPVIGMILAPFFALSKLLLEITAGVRVLVELIKRALGLSSSLDGKIGGAIGAAAARGARAAVGGGSTGFRGFADGGIVTRPTLSLSGERGPEAIIPLNKPNRAMEILRRAGMSTQVFVQVLLGTREITDILDVRVSRAFDSQARELAYGPRSS